MSPNPSNPKATRSPTTTSVELGFHECSQPRNSLAPPCGVREPLLRYRVSGEVFEHPHQPRVIPGFAAERGGGVEQLLRRRRVGQREAERTRSLQSEVQILLVQFDAEARVECTLDHPLAMDFENAR